MTTQQEKQIALAQHLGLQVFEFEGVLYTGATQDEIDTLDAESELSFDEPYIESNYSQLEYTITEGYNDDNFEAEGAEYMVLTDSEADDAWDTQIDSYIDDCVLPELPEHYRGYFDSESFKRDCSYDGRGHTLSGYDGAENEETVNGTTYYIYRTN